MKVRISGQNELRSNIRVFRKNMEEARERALNRTIGKVHARSDEYAPKDSGDLVESSHIVESAKGQSVSVVYDSPHAVPVHEHLSEHSPYSWRAAEAAGRGIHWSEPGTGPKFLERAWMEESETYLEDLREDLQVERVGI